MDDRVSQEAKLATVKEIVCTVIKASVEKKEGGAERYTLSTSDVCKLFEDVYKTVNETLPSAERKVGLGR